MREYPLNPLITEAKISSGVLSTTAPKKVNPALIAARKRSTRSAYFLPLTSLTTFIIISPSSDPTDSEAWMILRLYWLSQYSRILYTIVKLLAIDIQTDVLIVQWARLLQA